MGTLFPGVSRPFPSRLSYGNTLRGVPGRCIRAGRIWNVHMDMTLRRVTSICFCPFLPAIRAANTDAGTACDMRYDFEDEII